MSDINELKTSINTKTLHFVLLSVATAGIYPIVWLYRSNIEIERVTKQQLASSTFIVWLMVCFGLSGTFAGTGDETLEIIAGLLSIASGVLYIVWAFKAKKALEAYALEQHKVDLRMNPFYTFLFNVYYVNYCINDLPELQRKQSILRGEGSAAI